jgi:broad specificity phosphatase PhoE
MGFYLKSAEAVVTGARSLWMLVQGIFLLSAIIMSTATTGQNGGSCRANGLPVSAPQASPALTATADLIVRFHFVRHGETEANLQGVVLGQTQSDLTRRGKEQAKLAGRALASTQFWGMHASDLDRARDTAHLITEHFPSYSSLSAAVALDPLLRERAKGIRECRHKSLSEEECLLLYRAEEDAQGKTIAMPLLETDDQVWQRLSSFIGIVVSRVVEQEQSTTKSISSQPTVLHILAVSHSGAIRILLNKLLSDPSWMYKTKDDGNESPDAKSKLVVDTGRLIPNCSITIIDVVPDRPPPSSSLEAIPWAVKQVQAPNIDHLEDKETPRTETA